MIGLCGGHRTGKTTLARAYAEAHQAIFVQTSVSAIIRAIGFDPSCTDYDFATRLTIQEGVLAGLEAVYDCVPAGLPAVADRTPIDLLGYTMAEAIGDRVPQDQQERFARYVQDCFNLCNSRFSTVILLQPGIPLVAGCDGKGAANPAFIEHLNSLMLGLTVDPRMKTSHFYIPRSYLSIEDRLSAMEGAVRRTDLLAQEGYMSYLAEGGQLQ